MSGSLARLAGAAAVCLLASFPLVLPASEPIEQRGSVGFEIVRWTVDAGGGVQTGNGYAMSSSIGQPDAHTMDGAGYELSGGILPLGAAGIFGSGFESGNTEDWSATQP